MRKPHRFAVIWWVRLTTVADLIEAQIGEISEQQAIYIQRLFFGPEPSFASISFDIGEVGDIAPIINFALMDKRPKLRAALDSLSLNPT